MHTLSLARLTESSTPKDYLIAVSNELQSANTMAFSFSILFAHSMAVPLNKAKQMAMACSSSLV